MTGLDEFKRVLAEYKNLSIWAAGASVVFPFIASFVSVIPPWPKGLDVITSILQLGALIVAYQTFRNSGRRVTRGVKLWAVLGLLAVLAYLVVFTLFTIYVPEAKRSIVIGFQCLPNAQQLSDLGKYVGVCPFLGLQDLNGAAYDEFLLWTRLSIAVTRTVLVALWFAIFICLAFMIGQFLVYQMRRTVGPDGPNAQANRHASS
jgi:hypothetical protein